jgi:type I restriction enzyme S subunit
MSVAVVPSGWTSDCLGNLVDIAIGKTPKRGEAKYWHDGQHKWATIASMKFGEDLRDTAEYITDQALRETNIKKVTKGTLLFSFKLTIGKMAFAGCDLYTNEAIAALTPKNGRIDQKFLYYALQVADLTANAGDAAKGSTLNTKTMPLIEVAFPEDIDEQRRIVARIEELTRRAEEARKLRQEAVAQIATQFFHVRRKIYQSLLSEFPTRSLGKCGKVIGGGTPSKQRADYWDGDISWVSAKDMKTFFLTDSGLKITKRGLSESSAKLIPENSVLFVVRGSILYRYVPIAVNLLPCTINQDLKAIVPAKGINSTYLAHMLWAANDILLGMVEEAGNTAGKLPTPSWSELDIPIPDEAKQEYVVKELTVFQDKLAELESLQEETAEELAKFQSALLAKAFRGEL